MGGLQTVGQKRVDRRKHVWRRRDDGLWKCVLCGGVTSRPADEGPPERVEPLTEEERAMCPKRLHHAGH